MCQGLADLPPRICYELCFGASFREDAEKRRGHLVNVKKLENCVCFGLFFAWQAVMKWLIHYWPVGLSLQERLMLAWLVETKADDDAWHLRFLDYARRSQILVLCAADPAQKSKFNMAQFVDSSSHFRTIWTDIIRHPTSNTSEKTRVLLPRFGAYFGWTLLIRFLFGSYSIL